MDEITMACIMISLKLFSTFENKNVSVILFESLFICGVSGLET